MSLVMLRDSFVVWATSDAEGWKLLHQGTEEEQDAMVQKRCEFSKATMRTAWSVHLCVLAGWWSLQRKRIAVYRQLDYSAGAIGAGPSTSDFIALSTRLVALRRQ